MTGNLYREKRTGVLWRCVGKYPGHQYPIELRREDGSDPTLYQIGWSELDVNYIQIDPIDAIRLPCDDCGREVCCLELRRVGTRYYCAACIGEHEWNARPKRPISQHPCCVPGPNHSATVDQLQHAAQLAEQDAPTFGWTP